MNRNNKFFSGQRGAAIFIAILLLGSCLPWSAINQAVRKGPWVLYYGEPTEMHILWQLEDNSTIEGRNVAIKPLDSCTINWGNNPDNLTSQKKITADQEDSYFYNATLSSLNPGAKYYYKISMGNIERTGSFVAAPAKDAENVNFFVYGDYYWDGKSGNPTHNPLAGDMIAMYEEDPSWQTMALEIGDIVLSGTTFNWDHGILNQVYDPNVRQLVSEIAYQPIVGNHETYSFGASEEDISSGFIGIKQFIKYFPFPYVDPAAQYWSFDYGPAHIVMLDNYDGGLNGIAGVMSDQQAQWLEVDLSSTDKPWTFLVIHEPAYGAGGNYKENLDVRAVIQPLCEKYGVAMVFYGHSHYYARASVNGVHHVTTAGAGGLSGLYDPIDPLPDYVEKFAKEFHFTTISIDGDQLTLEAITIFGEIIETFTMSQP